MSQDLARDASPLDIIKVSLAHLSSRIRSFRPHLTPEGLYDAEKFLLQQLRRDRFPGGPYLGLWARDAYFIGSFLIQSGHIGLAGQLVEDIAAHQITQQSVVFHGRGSPKTSFQRKPMEPELLDHVGGAIPTSIHPSYDEVYGFYPDIDSTCLFVTLAGELVEATESRELARRHLGAMESSLQYVDRLDRDEDSMPEQTDNEDWADNLLRTGKVTYSQGTYLRALNRLARVQRIGGHSGEADETISKLESVRRAVENRLWVGDRYCDSVDIYGSYVPTASQDTALLLLAPDQDEGRAEKHLRFLRRELDTENGVLNVTPPRAQTRPKHMEPNEYQNSAVWPWFTALHIEAELRYGDRRYASKLLRTVFPFCFFEWYNPYNPRKKGFYPFRTSASAILKVTRAKPDLLGTSEKSEVDS